MAEILRLTFDIKELSSEEHYAFNYCLALLQPEKFGQPFKVVESQVERKLGMTAMRRALNKGIEQLLAKGIIEAKRDGHRDWVPTVIRFDRLSNSTELLARPEGLITGVGE